MNPAQAILRSVLRLYQCTVSPVLVAVFGPLGFGCRYEPTCSQYAIDAIHEHGAWSGSWLAARRLCRCHPWGGCGHDPVPLRDRPPRQPNVPEVPGVPNVCQPE